MSTYLFDFDGTLVDSMPTYAALMIRILEENGIEYPENIIKIITPLGFIDTAHYFINEMGLKMEHSKLVGLMNEYAIDAYTHRIPAKATVIDTVRELKRRGHSVNVLTASPHDTLDPCLKRLSIFDLFDNVWSCNDFATNKSNPEIYKMAAQRLGVDVGELIFLDDNFGADRAAKAAGCKVIGVYDDTSLEYVEEMKALCDGYIYEFSELL
jgi:HAD superfamily hydrolase (TIGR01509 family)